MTSEQQPKSLFRKPYEVFGFTEQEVLRWRISQDHFEEILKDDQTSIHAIKDSSNNYGEFLFVTASRAGDKGRICMTFYGLGYHEHRERWITDEWFWYQASPNPEQLRQRLSLEEAEDLLDNRLKEIQPYEKSDTQTERGKLFDILADLTDDDGALAEIEDLENVADKLADYFDDEEDITPPTGENLLDKESLESLPPLYSGEDEGLEAQAQVNFFTPDAQWTWYASEFDGEDIFFGLVSGFELELGYLSLKELKEVKGPLDLPIERDLYYEPKSLRELMEWHEKQREE